MTSINNKEYLKKYLSIGKAPGEKKKKKKRKKGVLSGLKILDDDIAVNISEEIQQDLEGDTEDAPLIVSVIDDRPPSLRVDEDKNIKLWTPIGSVDDNLNPKKTLKLSEGFSVDRAQLPQSLKKLLSSKQINRSNDDFSPPRAKIKQEERSPTLDNSPPKSKNHVRILSPGKSNKKYDLSPSRRHRNSISLSPPRKIKQEVLSPRTSEEIDNSPPRRRKNSDSSPPRRVDNNIAFPNRNRDIETSPTRKRNDTLPKDGVSLTLRHQDKDKSPLRKKNNSNRNKTDNFSSRTGDKDISSPTKNRSKDNYYSRRSSNSNNSRDNSPPRKKINDNDISPPRRRNNDMSPPRIKKSRWGSDNEKMTTTLEGKAAGLQNAMDLAQETAEIKRKNDEMFRNMCAESSGKNAATVVRNFVKKGQKLVDPEEEERKRIKEEQNKEKYDQWGKGLKQVEAQNSRMEEIAHEMNKPLARYADDQDLEKYLKDQEREGDPMLTYMRKKKRKKDVDSGKPIKPQFQGEFPPNRFGIPPGYRWDGVDRSNGYEKKYFEVQNKNKADMEEAFKWSTEDM